MNALTLKIIAVVCMLLDHIGYITGDIVLRSVGRLAFPIFAFLIANGFRHTRSVPAYALRLLAFATLSEVPYDLFVSGKSTLVEFSGLLPDIKLDNVFFTLLLGLCFLAANDAYKKRGFKYAKLLSVLTFVFLAALTGFISADYGALGVAWVAMFGIFDVAEKKNRLPLLAGAALLSAWNIISKYITLGILNLTGINISKIVGIVYFFQGGKLSYINLLQPLAILSVALIIFYNGKSGMPENRIAKRATQYAFYAFYPLHLLALYFVAYIVL
ncbi:MAG: hypothetical protein IJ002_00530 [Clostridia bacterium]|nr:hypothetical protein [Clostridia bacterium]